MTGLASGERAMGWRADGHSIYAASNLDLSKTTSIFTLDLDTGKRAPFLEIHPMRPVDGISDISITPDGRAYAYDYRVLLSDLHIATGLK